MNDSPDANLNRISEAFKPTKQSGVSVTQLLVVLALTAMLAAVLVAFMLPASRVARPAARRSQCKNNLKQSALALHNYADAWDALPPLTPSMRTATDCTVGGP